MSIITQLWPRGGLWQHPEFLKLWFGETVSLLGSQVTLLALPLAASILMQASPSQMGLLGAAQAVPFLILGLVAGVWVDRLRRRPIMLAANLGRAFLLATVPFAAVLGSLRFEQLVVVAFVGIFDVFFGVAYASFLPSVVRRGDLAEGNAKLALSAEVGRVAGPGLAGLLVHLVTAPLAIAVDAASFLVSAVALTGIRAKEPPPVPSAERRSVRAEIVEGVRAVVGHPILRPLVGVIGLGNLGDGLLFGSGLYVLYATRELGIEPAALGGVLAGVGVGGLLGAAVAGPVTRRCGISATFIGAQLFWGASFLAAAFVTGPPPVAVALLAAAFAVTGTVNPIAGTNATTLRQSVAPDRLQGRITATARVVMWGGVTIGAVVGGLLAERIGLRPTIVLSGILPLVGSVWLFVSPVRGLQQVPSAASASQARTRAV
jgi:predicted MFS family arabinose efflux permease